MSLQSCCAGASQEPIVINSLGEFLTKGLDNTDGIQGLLGIPS